MDVVPPRSTGGGWTRSLLSPWLWLGLFIAGILLLLSLPLRIPIGPNYWDLAVYLDGAHRLTLGQMPHRDFFAPVGGLSYLLFLALESLWPEAHPLLIVQWCVLLVTLPPMVMVVRHVAAHSRLIALALLLPFLFFSAVPVNGVELYPSPGFDAYGNYNRHVCIILYALVSTLWFLPGGRRKTTLAGFMLLALFGIKITGFMLGVGLVVHAALAGQMRWRSLGVMLAALGVALAVFDAATGVVTAYLADIASLVAMNKGSLLSRFLTVASLEFDVLAGGTLLVLVLGLTQWRGIASTSLLLSASFITALANSHAARILVPLVGGALFESQNTGSQEFIFLWPMLQTVAMAWWRKPDAARPLVLFLVVATILPHAMKILHRTARAVASAPIYLPLAAPELGALGRVSAKRELMARADILLEHYVTHRSAYTALSDRNELPSAIVFSEIDFQLAWLKGVDQAIAALKAHEASTGRHHVSLTSLDFVDVFAPLMRRSAPLHMPIGLDAFRTFPEPDASILDDLAKVEGILVPTCPVLHSRRIILERFAPALAGRPVVELTPCWTLRPKP